MNLENKEFERKKSDKKRKKKVMKRQYCRADVKMMFWLEC